MLTRALGIGKDDFLTVLIYSAIAIAVGLGVNKLNKTLDEKNPRAYSNKWGAAALKLLPVALTIALFQVAFSPMARNFQGTTPGMFFVAFFFGVQTSLMEDVVRLF